MEKDDVDVKEGTSTLSPKNPFFYNSLVNQPQDASHFRVNESASLRVFESSSLLSMPLSDEGYVPMGHNHTLSCGCLA